MMIKVNVPCAANGFELRSIGGMAMNLRSTPRWVWIAIAITAVVFAEYLVGHQIPHWLPVPFLN